MFADIFRNIDFYDVFYYFLLYSFLGWVWEVFYVYLRTDKLVNRGFLSGPFCPIYGFGATAVYIVLDPVAENNIAVFFGGMILATVLEYATGTAMEKLFHAKWWDYSDRKFNLNGRICVSVSIGWGFLSVIMMRVLHPAVTRAVEILPYSIGNVLMYIIIGYFTADTIYAAKAAFSLDKALARIEDAREELRERIEGTKLYEARNELLARIEDSQNEFEELLRQKLTLLDAKYTFYREDFMDKMEDFAEAFPAIEQLSDHAENRLDYIKENRDEFMEKLNTAFEELKERHQRYMDLMNPTYTQKRLIKAFPDLKSSIHSETLDKLKSRIKNNVKKVDKK